jgi:hypothetical protein
MKKFNTIECVTDFPDDQIEEDGRIIQPGGRAAAFAVADLLRECGMITTVPQLDYEHGWQFEATQGEQTYIIQTTYLPQQTESRMVIYAEDQSSLVRRWFGWNNDKFVQFLNTLHRLLSQDERFISVSLWSEPLPPLGDVDERGEPRR